MFFRLCLKNNRLVPIEIELGQLVADPEQSHFKIGYKLEAKLTREEPYLPNTSICGRLATQLAYEII